MSRSYAAPLAAALTSLVALALARADDRPRKFDDIGFLQEAAAGGLMEVKAGKLAKESASDAKVRAFAERMVKDHTEADKELNRVATAMDVSLPKVMAKAHQEEFGRLEKLRAGEFDRAYMKQMVKGHEKAVEQFTLATKEARNEKLRAFAEKTLPTLKDVLPRPPPPLSVVVVPARVLCTLKVSLPIPALTATLSAL